MISPRRLAALALLLTLGLAAPGDADDVLRIERRTDDDRESLLAAGVPLIADLGTAFLARGDADAVVAAARNAGRAATVLTTDAGGDRLVVAAPRSLRAGEPPAACGVEIWREEGWRLLRTSVLDPRTCASTEDWRVRVLSGRPLKPFQAPPAELADLARQPLDTQPMVDEMVDDLTDADALATWEWLVDLATTRHSYSTGCQTAAAAVATRFAELGLDVTTQSHTTGMAPNVIGTLTGTLRPNEVVVVLGHLDDLPSSGLAPGADDNASGSAMVVALAEAMACYRFERTLRFVVVTGEEQGLYGSEALVAALDPGETVVAALNGDMIGWEGNAPATENLDVNYNGASAWLATLMSQAAADYGTGCVINAFSCPTMVYSDHAPFWSDGLSAICGITDNEGFCGQSGNYPYYHESADTIANCGPGAPVFFGGAVRAYLASAGHLAVPLERMTASPTGLTATPAGANQVDLAWTPGAAGLVHEVLRTPGGCAAPWLPAPLHLGGDPAVYTDASASGGVVYGYRVRSWDPSLVCVSAPTDCAQTTTSGPCSEPPQFAGVAAAHNTSTQTCGVLVEWPAVGQVFCGPQAVFNVYRGVGDVAPLSENRIAAGVAGGSWLDTDALAPDTDYAYLVRAVDTATGVEDLNEVVVTARPTGPVGFGTFADDAGDTAPVALVADAPWGALAGQGVGGSRGWTTGSYGNNLCVALTTPELSLGSAPELRFWSRWAIESGWDKGEVQLSTDDGGSWQRLPLTYPGQATYTGDACGLPTGSYFTGTGSTWTEFVVDLSAWAGQSVHVRWLLSTDSSQNGAGWQIDDVTLSDAGVPGPCTPGASGTIFADGFETGAPDRWSATVP